MLLRRAFNIGVNERDAPRPCHGPCRARPPRLAHAAKAATSSVRRYPKELLDSLSATAPADSGLLELDYARAAGPLSAAWLGHATVLLRVGGRWVLTDPVMSHRIGVRMGPVTVGLSRLLPPFDLATLPPIDLILLSHAHFDHLDRPTLKRLASPATRVITAANTRRLIPRGFGDVREIAWDRTLDADGLEIAALRPAHWGARTAWDRHRGFNSYVLSAGGASPRRVLFAGDTARTDAFAAIPRTGNAGTGGTDLTIFGIGAYDPWVHAHATPEQVWAMHQDAGGRHLLPMHHSTFRLSDEPTAEPLARLRAAAGRLGHRIVGAGLGEVWNDPGE